MADALIGTEVGSYKITSSIGVGGMGAVYLGVHPLIGKRVAIKVLHAEFADKQDVVGRFFNEARAVSLLRHPNIVELIDFGNIKMPSGEPLHYCIMELLEGETLRDRIKRGPMGEAEATNIANQIADAVSAAHRQQIIHRDLKPENVFLVGKNKDTVKLLDFGIAKLHDQGAASVQTQAGVLLGTPSYMSPEQCMGRQVDRRTDVYATGIILFEMCTGRVPFTGEGYADLLIKQISSDPPSPRSIVPSLSVGIERVIARALEKDPTNRFQSMEEFQAALAQPSQLAASSREMPRIAPGDDTIVGTNLSTTLSGATGEMSNEMTVVPSQMTRPPVKKSGGSGAVVFGLVAVLLLGGGAAGFLLLRGAGDKPQVVTNPPVPSPNNAVAAAAGAKKTRLHITSEPAGAEVVRKDTGEKLGTTPLDKDLPADGTLVQLSVKKDGFKETVRAIVLSDREATFAFRLVAEEGDPKAGAKVQPTKKTPPSGKRLPRPPGERLGDDILSPNLD